MAWCPFAVHRPLPENRYQPRIDPFAAIIHSAVDAPGPSTLFGFFARADVTVETHFFVKNDGVIEQYMDTEVRADGNRWANSFAVSIETEDDGNPDQRPWTLAQIVAIRRLLEWLFKTHPKIKRRVCPAWNAAGVGWHSMWGAPSPWTPHRGKTCPGTARKAQIPFEIVRWLTSGAKAPQAPTGPSRPATGSVRLNVNVLRQGSRGGQVEALQALLRGKAGQNVVVDGDFGPATTAAVKNVQRFFKLNADGIVGQNTWGVLFL